MRYKARNRKLLKLRESEKKVDHMGCKAAPPERTKRRGSEVAMCMGHHRAADAQCNCDMHLCVAIGDLNCAP